MHSAKAVIVAEQHGFEMWWERGWQAWAIRRRNNPPAYTVQARPEQVKTFTEQEFINTFLEPFKEIQPNG